MENLFKRHDAYLSKVPMEYIRDYAIVSLGIILFILKKSRSITTNWKTRSTISLMWN